MKFVNLLFVTIVFFSLSVVAEEDQKVLWGKLKDGGLVVFVKHTSVPKDGQDNSSLMQRDSTCKEERNLSKAGRAQAVRIGQRFRAHNIPIESVMHSPYCRTKDTAKLAFNADNEIDFLSLWMGISQEEEEKYQDQLTDLVSSFSGKGNLILITHSPNISSVSFANLERNAALVVKPSGEGEFEELGQIQVFDFLESEMQE